MSRYRERGAPGASRGSARWAAPSSRRVEESSPDALVGYLSTASACPRRREPDEREESLSAPSSELASRYGERFPLPRLTYAFALRRDVRALAERYSLPLPEFRRLS